MAECESLVLVGAVIAGISGLNELAPVSVVEPSAFEVDAIRRENALSGGATLGAAYFGMLAHGVLHLEDRLACGALVVIAGHVFLRTVQLWFA